MLVTAVRTAGFVLMSIVPVENAQVDVVLSVNWASEIDPAPIVRTETAPRRATIPRRRLRRRSIWPSVVVWVSMKVVLPFPEVVDRWLDHRWSLRGPPRDAQVE